jgi:hypothetical protein
MLGADTNEKTSINWKYNEQLEKVSHFFDNREMKNESGLDHDYEEELTKLAELSLEFRLAKITIDENLIVGDLLRSKLYSTSSIYQEKKWNRDTSDNGGPHYRFDDARIISDTVAPLKSSVNCFVSNDGDDSLKPLTKLQPITQATKKMEIEEEEEEEEEEKEEEEKYAMCGNPKCDNLVIKKNSNCLQFCDNPQCYELVHRDKAKELQREKRNFNPQCKTKGCEKERRAGSSWCCDECETCYTRERKSENKKKERSKKAKVDFDDNEIKV